MSEKAAQRTSEKDDHVPLKSLWKMAKGRATPSAKQLRHITACHECLYAFILCQGNRSIDEVQLRLGVPPDVDG